MTWNIASAKQNFSEVVRSAVAEPQLVYNRNRLAAVVLSPEEFADYTNVKAAARAADAAKTATTFWDVMQHLRGDADSDAVADAMDAARRAPDRPNAFLDMLDEEALRVQSSPRAA